MGKVSRHNDPAAASSNQGAKAPKTEVANTSGQEIIEVKEIIEQRLYLDPKSRFQEASQDVAGVTPNYKVLGENGPDHNKKFIVGLYLGEELIAQGEGTSKQEAQEAAARAGLEAKGWMARKTDAINLPS